MHDPVIVWISQDEDLTWAKRTEIPVEMNLPDGSPYTERYTPRGLNQLQDETLHGRWTSEIHQPP